MSQDPQMRMRESSSSKEDELDQAAIKEIELDAAANAGVQDQPKSQPELYEVKQFVYRVPPSGYPEGFDPTKNLDIQPGKVEILFRDIESFHQEINHIEKVASEALARQVEAIKRLLTTEETVLQGDGVYRSVEVKKEKLTVLGEAVDFYRKLLNRRLVQFGLVALMGASAGAGVKHGIEESQSDNVVTTEEGKIGIREVRADSKKRTLSDKEISELATKGAMDVFTELIQDDSMSLMQSGDTEAFWLQVDELENKMSEKYSLAKIHIDYELQKLIKEYADTQLSDGKMKTDLLSHQYDSWTHPEGKEVLEKDESLKRE